ncbi:efflux RND transporter periplasmic adaptor subunit [Paraburkholderia sp. MMS20-SJTR3]|uniref:Efflux RND transporter periplasmic adaptor subunit n=1 Tax=Paraburkholderia sejongensis TaxID=2886946 RepID=A0ABS8JR51_9BURK|nr:efflux RND transporter periplasmic adaptor subunit [Paraburkholderia sp. MMS20-SJTR3]MCC8392371.1 efflux RND transporter periplasmic adaptor subunit [Paraburkholderia sp. MMS20-SJTR3]
MKSIRLLVIAAIASAWYTASPSVSAQDVVTMPAVQKRIAVKVSAPAHVQAVSNAVLSAPTAGIVTGLRVGPGETVRAGQTIAHLAGPSVTSEKTRLATELKTAEIRVSAATQGVAIEKQKFDDQLSTRDAVARVRADLDAAHQQLLAAQSAAQSYAGLATVAASEPGVVTMVSAADGQYVSAGQPLVTVSSSRDLYVVANLYGSDAAFVAVGMKGAFLSEHGDAPTYVVVRRTSWSVATPGQLEVWLSPVEGSSPEPGSVGTISLSPPDERHLAVPSTALVLDGGEWWVLVHDKTGNHRRRVAPGLTDSGWTAIRNGLSAGELVVTQDAYLFFHQDFSTRYQQAD